MASGKRAMQAADTRARLVAAARELFTGQGYAGTGTDQILAQAGTTRGALYYHFTDKADLFAAVCEQMHAEAATAITQAATAAVSSGADAFAVLVAGCDAWMDHMAGGDVRRVLIIEAPSVLGWERWNDLDRRHGFGLLHQGILAAQADHSLPDIPVDDLTILLNGAMNYAVLSAQDPETTAQIERGKLALHAVLAAMRSQAGLKSR